MKETFIFGCGHSGTYSFDLRSKAEKDHLSRLRERVRNGILCLECRRAEVLERISCLSEEEARRALRLMVCDRTVPLENVSNTITTVTTEAS